MKSFIKELLSDRSGIAATQSWIVRNKSRMQDEQKFDPVGEHPANRYVIPPHATSARADKLPVLRR
jgi:hypothetical protein